MDKQMKRTEKTIQEYKEQLIDKGIKNIPEFVEMIIQSDITKSKYTRFLLDCFIANKFRMEDLQGGLESTVGQAVSLFHKHKSKLPENMRSVNKYASPGDLWSAVREFETVLTGKEEKKSEKEKAYAETEFVYHDIESGFQIISPKTEDAAKWWGKGTRWCTSAENNNMFKEYVKDAPLFVIIMPNSNKLQLWKGEDNIQFMDEADRTIELDYIENNWQYLKEICLSLNNLSLIPEQLRTKEICELAIQQSGDALYYVPKKLRTKELCELAVEKNGGALHYVPEQLRTKELCKLAIKQAGMTLHYVPEEYKTPELCKLAVEQDGWALDDVPKELKTKEICEIAVQQNGDALHYVSKELRTKKICQLAVKQDGRALENVPKELRTKKMCQIAVEQDGRALELTPEELRTKELCELAVQQNGWALDDVPKKLRTKKMCQLAVKQDGRALELTPEEYITPELCKIAVEQNGGALENVPKEHKTPELCQIAVEQNGEALQYVPEELKSQLNIPEFIVPDYTEQYNEIRSLFHKPEFSLNI